MSQKIHELFSSTVELQEFNTKNINHIPSFGSIIYTVFLDRTEFIYVGIGGLSGKSMQDRNLRSASWRFTTRVFCDSFIEIELTYRTLSLPNISPKRK